MSSGARATPVLSGNMVEDCELCSGKAQQRQQVEAADCGDQLLECATVGQVPAAADARLRCRLHSAIGGDTFRAFMTKLKASQHVPHVCVLDRWLASAFSFDSSCKFSLALLILGGLEGQLAFVQWLHGLSPLTLPDLEILAIVGAVARRKKNK